MLSSRGAQLSHERFQLLLLLLLLSPIAVISRKVAFRGSHRCLLALPLCNRLLFEQGKICTYRWTFWLPFSNSVWILFRDITPYSFVLVLTLRNEVWRQCVKKVRFHGDKFYGYVSPVFSTSLKVVFIPYLKNINRYFLFLSIINTPHV